MSAPVNGISAAGRRLYWTLQGPLPLASSVVLVKEANLDYRRDGWYDTYIEPNDDLYPSDQEGFEGMPPKFDPVVVTASNGQFVTIHDYLSTVHPWLVERRLLIHQSRMITFKG
ncbi:hypothetical protein RB596_002256 [Gaeumannomyces avenae]